MCYAPVVSAAKVQKIWEQFTTLKQLDAHFGGCFGCKSTKNLRAIHNIHWNSVSVKLVVSAAKVQKIWEQFTTRGTISCAFARCFGCKSTKNLRAIHNRDDSTRSIQRVVSAAKVQKIWEQFTTAIFDELRTATLFRLQKYKKFESNSQLSSYHCLIRISCFGCNRTTHLRAIHH